MVKVILLCSLLAVIHFSVQLALCQKAGRKAVKLIPIYLAVVVYAAALLLCLVDLVNGSGGVAIWWIFAFIIAIANTVALVADVAAWVVYKMIHQKSRMT